MDTRLLVVLAALLPSIALAGLDPGCLEQEPFICFKVRTGDATLADEAIAPVLAKAGWDRGCYTVQYVKGDDGRPDTLLVMVNGPPGAKPPACNEPVVEGLSSQESQRIYNQGGRVQEMTKAISKKSIAKGKRESASSAQLREIGGNIKKAILTADSNTRCRLLMNTKKISLGSGYGAEADIPLP